MQIYSVNDAEFKPYGKVLEGYDVSALINALDEKTPLPDTSKVKAFKAEKGQVVEVYETSLHYAPCSAKAGDGFKVVIVLPKGTNGSVPKLTPYNEEDKWMTACNKWLLAHAESAEAKDGAYVGLTGENIDIAGLI